MPPYFKQEHSSTCSLAVLRSVLAFYGKDVSESELMNLVQKDYDDPFKNIWNPTIAKLAQQYGVTTNMYALWPLFKPGIYEEALAEYRANQDAFDANKYENPTDTDDLGEPLPLAYKEMFKAIELGCHVTYDGLTESLLKTLLDDDYIVQTSIKNRVLYKTGRGYHSLLLFNLQDGVVTYHDPAKGANLQCSVKDLLKAANGTGAFMAYKS